MSDATTQRVSTERARELVAGATPGPWRGDRNDGSVKYAILAGEHEAPIVVLTCDHKNARYGFGCGDDYYDDAAFAANPDADEQLVLAAPDLAADLIDARETIAQRDVEIVRLTVALMAAGVPVPNNSRPAFTEDLTTCADCGKPSTGWKDADDGRAVGACDDHAAPARHVGPERAAELADGVAP